VTTGRAAIWLMTSLVVMTAPASAAAQSPGGTPAVLPPAITKELDARISGWSIAPATEDSMAAWRNGARNMPNVERGDYDGNGLPDYVLAIVVPRRGAVTDEGPRIDVVVFLQRRQSYRFLSISEDAGPRIEIRANAKGDPFQEYGEESSSVLTRDAFTVSPGDAGPCYTFVYRRGRFEAYWTCD